MQHPSVPGQMGQEQSKGVQGILPVGCVLVDGFVDLQGRWLRQKSIWQKMHQTRQGEAEGTKAVLPCRPKMRVQQHPVPWILLRAMVGKIQGPLHHVCRRP